MEQSESIKELATALAKAQGAFKAAKKTSFNPHFKSNYADLAEVWEAAREALKSNSLSVTQVSGIDSGTPVLYTQLMHSSGEYIRGVYPLYTGDANPQKLGAAVTYARRYAFCAITGMTVEDEDDDGNAASGVVGKSASPLVDTEQAATIDTMLKATNSDKAAFLTYFRVDDVRKLKASDYHTAIAMLNKKAEKPV